MKMSLYCMKKLGPSLMRTMYGPQGRSMPGLAWNERARTRSKCHWSLQPLRSRSMRRSAGFIPFGTRALIIARMSGRHPFIDNIDQLLHADAVRMVAQRSGLSGFGHEAKGFLVSQVMTDDPRAVFR